MARAALHNFTCQTNVAYRRLRDCRVNCPTGGQKTRHWRKKDESWQSKGVRLRVGLARLVGGRWRERLCRRDLGIRGGEQDPEFHARGTNKIASQGLRQDTPGGPQSA